MKNTALLTIVIPVYKVEPYINKCLDSLLIFKQDVQGGNVINDELMSLMDILIVNDGTPDRSAELSREYVKKYPQYFRQIDKANGGHGSVWNIGVQEAYGKYLRFLDSDDWLDNLGKFLRRLQNTDSDLILTNVIDHCKNNEIWVQQILDMEFYKSYDADKFDWQGNRSDKYLLHHCCTYKTSVLREWMPDLFLEKQPYDDVILWPAALIGANSIEAFDMPLYHYRLDRPGQSISPEVRRKNMMAVIKVAKQEIEFYENHPVDQKSTRSIYITNKLPKLYARNYRDFVKLPYKEGKTLLKDWDSWAKKVNCDCQNLFIKAYRKMPYFLYRPMCLFGLWILSKRKVKETGPSRFIRG